MCLRRDLLPFYNEGMVSSKARSQSANLSICERGQVVKHLVFLESNCIQKLLLMWLNVHLKLAAENLSVLSTSAPEFRSMKDVWVKESEVIPLWFRKPLNPGSMWQRNPCMKTLSGQESLMAAVWNCENATWVILETLKCWRCKMHETFVKERWNKGMESAQRWEICCRLQSWNHLIPLKLKP